jgi:hypothetical protein
MVAESKMGLVRRSLLRTLHGQIAVRLFSLLPYLHPFDTARRSNRTGRLRARRRIRYWSEQNGQSVARRGVRLLQNKKRIIKSHHEF